MAGNGGYNDGERLAFSLGSADNINNTYFVSYLALNDAAVAENGNSQDPVATPARELSFNGVLFSNSAVEEGLYTFWTYEHLDYNNGASAAVKTFSTSLRNQLNSGDDEVASYGITMEAMDVARSSDGGTVAPTY